MGNGCVVDKEFPLTAKWLPLIRGSSFRNKVPFEECLQEAYIVEWLTKRKKISSKTHRENYFKKVLYRRLNNRLPRRRTFRRGVSISDLSFLQEDKRLNEDEMFDRLIQLRPFNEIFYDELITHVVIMLQQIDKVAGEICRLKVSLGYGWQKLRKEHFSHISPYKWNKKLKLIKATVLQEVCDDGSRKDYNGRTVETVGELR